MLSHQIEFNYRAIFYYEGAWDPENVYEIWFVLHGYGQLAGNFLKKFNSINREGRLIIAPEGLSHFYLQGYQGKVGASWMTSENRELAITNQLSYLQKVYQTVFTDFSIKKIHVTILGFSQGVATAGRLALMPETKFDRFIIWAGNFPAYQKAEEVKEKFKNKEVITVYGNQDPLINNRMIEDHNNYLKTLGITPYPLFFEGAHDLDEDTLWEITRK